MRHVRVVEGVRFRRNFQLKHSLLKLFDNSPLRRIIKDVMKHQLGEGEEAKNQLKKVAGRLATGLKNENARRELLTNEEIDPAHFFDPEEFDARGRDSKLFRP